MNLLSRFRGSRLLVVGDLMLDRFLWGEVERISPEAPVPIVRVTSESLRLGGAANVIHNLRALGVRVTACGVLGRDPAGKKVLQALKKIGCSTTGVFCESNYMTTQKSRVIASPRHQQLVRLDHENKGEISSDLRRRICDFVVQQATRCDGVVISDYSKGVVHSKLLERASELTKKKGILCVVDPKKENYSRYRYATLVTPNKEEASEAAGIRIVDEISFQEAGRKLLEIWQAQAVLITQGQEGMTLFRPDGTSNHFSTSGREVFDVTGAGDTVVAACAAALASGGSYEEAAVVANVAAGIVVAEVGTAAVSVDALGAAIRDCQVPKRAVAVSRRTRVGRNR